MNTYSLLDFGNGKRLEQWGKFRLIRPDPTAVEKPTQTWDGIDAEYKGEKGQGEWMEYTPLPSQWPIDFDEMKLYARLSPYKHTGIFPEQHQNWRWMKEVIDERKKINVLNLFAYTGGATMSLARDGHNVTHVDAAKPAIFWAKENAKLNDLPSDRIRWLLEDAALFTKREGKRGKRYDGIIIDPPAYGHSPTGKTWRSERDLKPLLETCVKLLSDEPVFLVLNGYAQHDTPESFRRVLTGITKTLRPELSFDLTSEELFLTSSDGRKLSTGIVARVSFVG